MLIYLQTELTFKRPAIAQTGGGVCRPTLCNSMNQPHAR